MTRKPLSQWGASRTPRPTNGRDKRGRSRERRQWGNAGATSCAPPATGEKPLFQAREDRKHYGVFMCVFMRRSVICGIILP